MSLLLKQVKKRILEAVQFYPVFANLVETDAYIEDILTRLSIYVENIIEYNKKVNITGAKTVDDVVDKHIIDSIVPLLSFPHLFGVTSSSMKSLAYSSKRIADVGTGAGLPGIPLSLFLPKHLFLLIESKGRKHYFLEMMKSKLQLSNVENRQSNVAEVKDKVDIVTIRAFSDMNSAVKKTKNLVVKGSYYLFYKGKRDVVENEIIQLHHQKSNVTCYPLKMPFLNMERHLVKLNI